MAHGDIETSQVPRLVWVAFHLAFVGVVGWVCFGGGLEEIGRWFGASWAAGDSGRRIVLMVFSVVLWIRMTTTAFVFLRRKFGWDEAGAVIFAVFLYQVVFAVLGANEAAPLGPIDYGAIALFALGSYLNTGSEYQRKKFKEKPENKGKLYTGGLFRLARHINYFGDTCWVAAWAIVTRDIWSAIMPAMLGVSFPLAFIPQLSKHLREHYGEQFIEWEKRSKKFIPFVY